ncbi:hypothetical protein ACFL1K_01675 [Candidatus Omnitrophota bacterium]
MSFFKKILSRSTSTALGTTIGIIVGTLLSLFLGEELRAKIAHDIFVYASAIEQILKTIPRLAYFLALLISVFFAIFYKKELNKERSPKEKTSTSYDWGGTQVILYYPNPDKYPHLTPYEIANTVEAKIYCLKCNSDIIENDGQTRCNCSNIIRYKGFLAEHKELARQKLIEALKANLSK